MSKIILKFWNSIQQNRQGGFPSILKMKSEQYKLMTATHLKQKSVLRQLALTFVGFISVTPNPSQKYPPYVTEILKDTLSNSCSVQFEK